MFTLVVTCEYQQNAPISWEGYSIPLCGANVHYFLYVADTKVVKIWGNVPRDNKKIVESTDVQSTTLGLR